MLFIVVLQQFGPDLCQVYIRRTLSPTAFAGQTRVQHLLDQLRIAAACQHLAQHVSPGPRRLGLVAAHLEGRAHRTAHQVRLSAVASPVALLNGAHQGMRLRPGSRSPRRIAFVESSLPVIIGMVGPYRVLYHILLSLVEAQHAVHGQRVYNLMSVQQIFRIPAMLHLPHQLVSLLPIEQRDELAAQPSVAMFAADAAPVFLHQEGSLVGNLAEQFPSFLGFQVDNRPQVEFARADMSVKDTLRIQPPKHVAEILHIGRQQPRSHRRIFNHAHRPGIPLHATQNAQPGLAQVPHLGDIGSIDARTFVH